MPPLPALSPEQQQEALAKAAAVRKARAAVLAEVKTGKTAVTAVLAAAIGDKEHPVHGARIRQVVLAVPGIGPVRARQIMTAAGIDPESNRRVRGLGTQQHKALAAALS